MFHQITIVPVTQQNRQLVEQLDLFPHQIGYIESVKDCMLEADNIKNWYPVGIWNKETLIGFAMYGKIQDPQYTRLWFDRFLIDKKHQGKGYAKSAIQAILSQLKNQYPDTDIYLSVYEENKKSIALYQSFGFQFTGEWDTNGEKIMCLEHIYLVL